VPRSSHLITNRSCWHIDTRAVPMPHVRAEQRSAHHGPRARPTLSVIYALMATASDVAGIIAAWPPSASASGHTTSLAAFQLSLETALPDAPRRRGPAVRPSTRRHRGKAERPRASPCQTGRQAPLQCSQLGPSVDHPGLVTMPEPTERQPRHDRTHPDTAMPAIQVAIRSRPHHPTTEVAASMPGPGDRGEHERIVPPRHMQPQQIHQKRRQQHRPRRRISLRRTQPHSAGTLMHAEPRLTPNGYNAGCLFASIRRIVPVPDMATKPDKEGIGARSTRSRSPLTAAWPPAGSNTNQTSYTEDFDRPEYASSNC